MKIYLLAMLFLIVNCTRKEERVKPIIKTITESVYASGRLKSQNQYNVYSTVSGIVQDILIQENDVVKIDFPLFILANESQTLMEKNAQLNLNFNARDYNNGKLKEAQTFIKLAKQKMASDEQMYLRQQNLWSQGIGSKVELEQRALAFENAKVNYTSALQTYDNVYKQISFLSQQSQINLLLSRKSTKDYIVKSHIHGKVFQINTTKGEFVTPQVPLAIIGDEYKYILEMQVDEYDIVSIKSGMKVFVNLDSYKDSVFIASVTKINPIMNIQSKTFTVEAKFVKSPSMLYPGISFEANILIKSKKNAVLIPRKFLKNDSIVVLRMGKEKVVKTGLKDFQMVEISSGINSDDELILPSK